MKLTPEQHAQFERDGYLFFPGLFSPEETRSLTGAVPELYSRREAYNVREKDSDAVRTNFAAARACRPRMLPILRGRLSASALPSAPCDALSVTKLPWPGSVRRR